MSLVMRDNKLLKLMSKSVNKTIGLIGWFMTFAAPPKAVSDIWIFSQKTEGFLEN